MQKRRCLAALQIKTKIRMFGLPAYELFAALLAIAAITGGYVWVAQGGVPQAGGWLGHSLGIVGFLMMLSTETLYSLRKRWPGFHAGPMSIWLQLHIFTGLVGPYLVLLHTGWKFSGLAGVLTLLTLVVVFSGIIGRYIYTAVPRTLDGVEVEVGQLEERIAGANQQLQKFGLTGPATEALAVATAVQQPGWLLVLGRPVIHWMQRERLRYALGKLDAESLPHAPMLKQLLGERQRLQTQLNSLDATRRLLALWHLFHIPMSGMLFALAGVHIVAALYYATLIR
jgi:hypothetical protein